MGYLEGLLAGFNERHQQYRDEQMQQEQERNRRESAVFNTLLSSPDPEIQAMAATGMITGAMGPSRKGGLRGWIGDMTTNPVMGKIRDLINTPTPGALPSRSITGVVDSAPGSAGQVSTQTTRAGAPAPTATSPDAAIPYRTEIPPQVGQPPPTAAGPTGPAGVSGLSVGPLSQPPPGRRHVFPTPEELAAQHYRGEYSGEIEGIAGALLAADPNPNREEAKANAYATARDHFLRSRGVGAAGGLQLVHGKDAQGKDAEGMFDKRPGSPTYGQVLHVGTDQPIEGFIASSVSQPRPTDRWAISQQVAQERGEDPAHLSPASIEEVNRRLATFGGTKTTATTAARMGTEATGPLSTEQRMHTIETYSQQWNALMAPTREMQRNLLVAQAALNNYEKDPNGSSQAVLKAFETILDPRETGVRAQDFGLTKGGQDLFDRVQALYQRTIAGGGQGVTKENLQGLLTTAQAIVQGMQGFNAGHKARISKTLTDFGIDPGEVILDEPGAGPAAAAPVAPQVGAPPPVRGATGGGTPQAYQDPVTHEWHIR